MLSAPSRLGAGLSKGWGRQLRYQLVLNRSGSFVPQNPDQPLRERRLATQKSAATPSAGADGCRTTG